MPKEVQAATKSNFSNDFPDFPDFSTFSGVGGAASFGRSCIVGGMLILGTGICCIVTYSGSAGSLLSSPPLLSIVSTSANTSSIKLSAAASIDQGWFLISSLSGLRATRLFLTSKDIYRSLVKVAESNLGLIGGKRGKRGKGKRGKEGKEEKRGKGGKRGNRKI